MYNCIILSQMHVAIDKAYSRPIFVNDIYTGMKSVVYNWFPYQRSDCCHEVNDITLQDIWVISAQGHFPKDTVLFPRKISNILNRCPMKAFVRDGQTYFTTLYLQCNDSYANVRTHIKFLEFDLLSVVLLQMNRSSNHVSSPIGL